MKIDKIIFYYPSKITGGAEYLFLRCSEYLSEHQKDYSVYYVDYEDGFFKKNTKSSKVNFIPYYDGLKTTIPDGACVIVQLNIIAKVSLLFEYDHHKSLFIFWALHMLNLKNYIYEKGYGYFLFWWEKRRLGETIKVLAEKNVLKFMSAISYVKITKDFYQKPQEFVWLHNIIPIDTSKPEPSFSILSENVVKFCWLGRLDSEKARNVETYMNELEELSSSIPLTLSLIGVGQEEKYLKKISRKYSFPIFFVGEKRDNELDEFIKSQSDIGLASGTSALEFSIRGKPVIYEGVLDSVYAAGERKKYYLITESSSITYDKNFNVYRLNEGPFVEKVNQILNNYEKISRESYHYVMRFTAENCCQKMLFSVKQAITHEIDDILLLQNRVCKLLNRGYKRKVFVMRLRSVFSIK